MPEANSVPPEGYRWFGQRVYADGELAESILRKIAANSQEGGRIFVERYKKGGIDGLIDSSWFEITDQEADYLERLTREVDPDA